jgi:hypothetical protein
MSPNIIVVNNVFQLAEYVYGFYGSQFVPIRYYNKATRQVVLCIRQREDARN